MEFKDIPRCKRAPFINMGKLDDRGDVITAMVHRNQVHSFQSNGWIIPPSEGIVDIPKQTFTDDQLRAHDAGKISLVEDSALRDMAARNPELRDHALANAAIQEGLRNPDPQKIGEIEERYASGHTKRRKDR